ncbi:MAG: trypsin-like peptidase domain-containing protein [Planctomycetota bacterium]|nr:trypsin-like peptidase domain-containing protein [Planctomycetota bacterium]
MKITPVLSAVASLVFLAGCQTASQGPLEVESKGISALEMNEIFSGARDRVYPALVHVQPIRETYVGGRMRLSTATGSGVIIDPAGHVITNYHVSGKAEESICTLSDKKKIRAKLIGGDPLTDIAVIRLDKDQLEREGVTLAWSTLGDSSKLEVGHWVLAMGSPLGFSRTMSQGTVSHTERVFPGADLRLGGGQRTGFFNTWIQTTAAINPGNSGGPLVDLEGRVVGINARTSLFANNLGFAIPIDVVKEVVDQILKHGKVTRSTIGLECQPLGDLAEMYGTDMGVVVSGVVAGSPADQAGVRAGDLITSYAGIPLRARTREEFPAACKDMADVAVGQVVDVVALRGGNEIRFQIETREMGKLLGDEKEIQDWGLTVQGLTEEMARERRLRSNEGVLVTGVVVGGRAHASTPKLLGGDVIRVVDGKAVSKIKELVERLAELEKEKKEMFLVKVMRGSVWKLIVVEPKFGDEGTEDQEGGG